MENKEKNVTNEEFMPYLVLKRLDCLIQQAKNGEEYYMFSGIMRQNEKSVIVPFYTKEKSLYSDVLAIPTNKEFKLYYELYLDYQNNWKVKPVACGL